MSCKGKLNTSRRPSSKTKISQRLFPKHESKDRGKSPLVLEGDGNAKVTVSETRTHSLKHLENEVLYLPIPLKIKIQ